MQDYNLGNNQELTERALENLRRNAELRKKDTKFVRLQPGEKAVLYFNPEKIEPVEFEFNGKKEHTIPIYSNRFQTLQIRKSTLRSVKELRR